jgi:hypothetical protein
MTVALLAALFIYNGSDNYPKSGENPPPKNMVTGAGQNRSRAPGVLIRNARTGTTAKCRH